MSERPAPRFVIAMLLAIVVAGSIDVALDVQTEWRSFHVAVELTLILLSLGTSIFLWWRWYRSQRSLDQAREALETRRSERDAWRERAQRLLEGLGEEIDRQLRDWGLTPAERQTALFLLKGLSHKEIARLTERSERTVRQHAVSVYRKSGLSGRAGLSAFFLEDLLLPFETAD
jgi:DNA-binding CsgD family transcriptional regulator